MPGSFLFDSERRTLLAVDCPGEAASRDLAFLDPLTGDIQATIEIANAAGNWVALTWQSGNLLALSDLGSGDYALYSIRHESPPPEEPATELFRFEVDAGERPTGLGWDPTGNVFEVFCQRDAEMRVRRFGETGALLSVTPILVSLPPYTASNLDQAGGLFVGFDTAAIAANVDDGTAFLSLDPETGETLTGTLLESMWTRDLECDPITFSDQDQTVVWAVDAKGPNLRALQVPRDACSNDPCDGVDNDQDGTIDENCFLKLLAVSWEYTGDDSSFEQAAAERLGFFLHSLELDACPQNIQVDIISPSVLELHSPTDCKSRSCYSLWSEFDSESELIGGPARLDYTLVAAFTNDPQFSGGVVVHNNDFVAVAVREPDCTNPDGWPCDDRDTLAHEIGHLTGLDDEYRYTRPEASPINPTDPNLGCDYSTCCYVHPAERISCPDPRPMTVDCPWPVCHGNESWRTEAPGRCIMSWVLAGQDDATDSPVPRGWCEHCWRHLKQLPPQGSGAGFAAMEAPLSCTSSYLGDGPLLDLTATFNPVLTIENAEFVPNGRRPLGIPKQNGEYEWRLEDAGGALIYRAAFDYDPAGTGTELPPVFGKGIVGARIMLPPEVASTEPYRLVIAKGPDVLWVSTLNGQAPIADAGDDQVVECGEQGFGSVVLDGRLSYDPDGDTLAYRWWGAGLELGDEAGATPLVLLPLGSTDVSLIVSDGLLASDPAEVTIAVVDTRPPDLRAAQMPQFYTCESGAVEVNVAFPEVTDDCSATVNLTGAVVDSSNPALALPVVLDSASVTLPVGSHTIRWVATDESSNSTTVDQVIEVLPAIHATERLELRDGALLVAPSGAYAAVGNSGTELTYVGVEARVGDIFSQASVELRDRAYVDGSVQSAGVVTPGRDVVVTTGTILEGVLGPVPPVPDLMVEFAPEDEGPIYLEPGQSDSVQPAAFADVTLRQGAILTLAAGTYYMRSLTLDPEARLDLDAGEGMVEVYVQETVTHRGEIAGSGSLLLGYVGTAAVYVEAPFTGRIVAPDAEVVIRGEFQGSVVARRLVVDAHEMLQCTAGTGAGPGGSTCFDGQQNGDETDRDCGGPSCAGCPQGASCLVAADCASGVCIAGVCEAPGCADGIQNGDESDVDCGGGCAGCPDGYACSVDADCQSNVCEGGICQGVVGGRPCEGLCTAPLVFSGPGYGSGNLGTSAACYETMASLSGGNCGNFASGRTFTLNGETVTCNWQNWPSLPPARNGGYCLQASPGDYAWAAFTTW